MPFLFQYLIKLSISLAVIYLFYHFILRRLTFYYHNRWYLAGYTLLAFFLSFINISPLLEKNKLVDHTIIQLIPHVTAFNSPDISNPATAVSFPASWTVWD